MNAPGSDCAYGLAVCWLAVLREEEALIPFCTNSDSAGDVGLGFLISDGDVQVTEELPGHGPSMGACNSGTVAAYNRWSNVTISQPPW